MVQWQKHLLPDFHKRLLQASLAGERLQKVDVQFDYEKSIAKTEFKEIKIDFKARDPYSMFYYLRTIPLERNKVMSFTSYEGKRVVDYNLQFKNDEKIKTPFGTINCKVVRPFREGKNLFKNQGDMQIWISDDDRKLPVKILIMMKYGSMTLLLNKFSS